MADEKGNVKYNQNIATIGLNMDNISLQKGNGQYSYALNAALENFNSNTFTIQNELGNELCITFPDGFALIGTHFIVERDKHIFFITNPGTGDSQIGYMDNNDCTYHILVDAPCLNFSVNHPIHKVVHRVTNCSTEIYWTDGYNPRRYLDINPENFPKIIKYGAPLCNPVYTSEIDCNQLRVQPNFEIPTLSIIDIINTGDLIAGTYQFAIQYSDAIGNPYTSYYSITNPVPIANPEITTMNFNYPVGKSIIINIENLDITGQFEWFNIAVIKTINNISSVELIGTYSIDNANKKITYTGQNVTNIKLSIDDIFEKYPYYDVADDITTAQDILIWKGVSTAERINYQKIANQIHLQWETWRIPSTESYANEYNATNLRSFLRDEVYAIEIQFLLNNGKETDGFHIPGRTKNFLENTYPDIPNTNADFIGSGTSAPYWKIYNTATVEDTSPEYTTASTYKGPYQYGEFAYWESEEKYPCNSELWGDLAGQNIRHHKFPDVFISPIFESKSFVDKQSMIMGNDAIFPIGIRVNISQIIALIEYSDLTVNQKADIVGFKILRGNRNSNKSIIAKGILRNVNEYTKNNKTYYFPNYPYNDLREDPFLNSTNNAYINECSPFTVDVETLHYDANKGYECALVQYIDCSNNKSAIQEYNSLGLQDSLCSVQKPTFISGSGKIKYVNHDVWRITASPFAVVQYEDTTLGITEKIFTDGDVEVVPGTEPSCLGGCSHPPVFIESVVSDSCIAPQSIPAITDAYRHVFNSPETSFGQPFLGDILKVESVMFGAGKAHFEEVNKNAKYRLISKEAQQKALDSSAKIGNITNPFDASAMFAAYQAYLQIYINGITRKNYAYSFNSIASYNYTSSIPNDLEIKQRNIDIARYLIPAVVSVDDDKDINNWQRESSVYIKTESLRDNIVVSPLLFPDKVPNIIADTLGTLTEYSRFTISEAGNCNNPRKEEPIQVISYYASLKKYFAGQWGQIYSYETIDTGFQCIFDAPPLITTIFGGDTFINKFAFKTKLPFFIDNRVGAPDDSDIFYDEIGNVAYPKYWHSSRSILDNYTSPIGKPGIMVNFISYKAHNFDCPNDTSSVLSLSSTTTTTTIQQTEGIVTSGDSERTYYNGYFYLFAYGIPNFYCESSYNLDLRQAFNNREGDFWPHVGDYIPDDWLQESFVSIANDNTYYYNITYSKQNKENYFSHLPPDWENNICYTQYPFKAIYSDVYITDAYKRVNPWRIYRAISYYDFPQNYGNLTSLDGIQNSAVLARFENKTLLYNNLLTIDTSNPQAAYLGNPGLFKGAPPIDFAETDLGYVGSQHKMLLKIPQGQITIDAKRGYVFLIQGTQATDISGFGSGMNRFLTDHLSFKILEYFPDVDVDNHFNGIGLHAVYDNKFERVIITKLDYVPIDDNVQYDSEGFYIIDSLERHIPISLKDNTYFCNKSFTLSYNMNTKSWISFHSYIPNFYIAENNFFYSGQNNCCDDFDFIAGELPSLFDCSLYGYAVVPGCEDFIPTTTTTTSIYVFTTTTTSTTICSSTTTTTSSSTTTSTTSSSTTTSTSTTTTTTICVRPSMLPIICIYAGYSYEGVDYYSTGSAIEACDTRHFIIDTPDPSIIPICIPVEIDGNNVYLSDGTSSCECNVNTGWYFVSIDENYDYVIYIRECQIVDQYSCATTTTTTTIYVPPTTTTSTTRIWDCRLEGNANELCTTTTTTTTGECIVADIVEVICEDVTPEPPVTTTTSTTIYIEGCYEGLLIEAIYIHDPDDLLIIPEDYEFPGGSNNLVFHQCNRALYQIFGNDVYICDSRMNNNYGIGGGSAGYIQDDINESSEVCTDYYNVPNQLSQSGVWEGNILSRYSRYYLSLQNAIQKGIISPGNTLIKFMFESVAERLNIKCEAGGVSEIILYHDACTWIRITDGAGTIIYNDIPKGEINDAVMFFEVDMCTGESPTTTTTTTIYSPPPPTTTTTTTIVETGYNTIFVYYDKL